MTNQNQTNEFIRAVSISTNGNFLVASSSEELLLFKDNNFTARIKLGFIKDISISEDGKFIAVATPTSISFLGNSGELLKTFPLDTPPESVALSAKGNLLVVGTRDSIHLIEPQNDKLWSYNLNDVVYDVTISPEGDFVAAGTKLGFTHLFAKDGSLISSVDSGSSLNNVALTQNAGYLAVGNSEGIHLFDTEGNALWQMERKGESKVDISSKGNRLLVGIGNAIFIFKIPETGPLEISITSPTKGSRVSDIIEIKTEKSRSARVNLYIDETLISKNSKYAFDSHLISNGHHTITAEAQDFLGNIVSDSVEIYVENEFNIPPPIKILNIQEGDILSGSVSVKALANLPFEEILLYVDGEKFSSEIPFEWNTRKFKDGLHEISLIAKRFDNVYTDSVMVFVKNIKGNRVTPFVKIFNPLRGQEIEGVIAIRAITVENPLEVYVKVDNKIVSDSLPFVWDSDIIEPGNHKITVIAMFENGNFGIDSLQVVKPVPSDLDNDGWSNQKEEQYKTNSKNADSDEDGIFDSIDEDPVREQKIFYTYLYGILILLMINLLLVGYKDLRFINLLTILAILFIVFDPINKIFLRIPLSIFLIFFAPGYAFISILFPKNDLSILERLTLSVALSIIIFVFSGFVLNSTWGFGVTPITTVISFIILVFSAIAALVRIRHAKTEIFDINFNFPKFSSDSFNEIEKATLIALVISIILASSMLVYAKYSFDHEQFTSLYILGKDMKTTKYPKAFFMGNPQFVNIGVQNFERSHASYKLEVKLNGVLKSDYSFTLGDKEIWTKEISVMANEVGENSKLEFLLFKDDFLSPYRSVYLWVTSIPNYADIRTLETYSIKEKPIFENWDFELNGTGWFYHDTNGNFSGSYSDETYTSPSYSYKLSLGNRGLVPREKYSSIKQRILSDGGGLSMISFNSKHSYSPRWDSGKFYKQVLLNGWIIWEYDLSNNIDWQNFVLPVILTDGINEFEFRLIKRDHTGWEFSKKPVKVWWDDIKLLIPDELYVL
jgi:uncharacterized membrane protein